MLEQVGPTHVSAAAREAEAEAKARARAAKWAAEAAEWAAEAVEWAERAAALAAVRATATAASAAARAAKWAANGILSPERVWNSYFELLDAALTAGPEGAAWSADVISRGSGAYEAAGGRPDLVSAA